MSHEDCLRDHQPTGLAKGEKRTAGKYYRCLESSEIKRIYNNDAAKYGYRLRPADWTGWTEDGVSVTDATCARSPACALHFHPRRRQSLKHVVSIDLAALSQEIGIQLAAVFDPIEETPQNPCHFVIAPTDVALDDLFVALRGFMQDDFPGEPRTCPRTEPNITLATEARARYDAVFLIMRDVPTA